MTLQEFFTQEAYWSDKTFGPASHRNHIGPLKHLEKEAKEAYEEEDKVLRLLEYADCIHLIFDACRRDGFNYHELVEAVNVKFKENQLREWPDWRNEDASEPIEHKRDEDLVGIEEEKPNQETVEDSIPDEAVQVNTATYKHFCPNGEHYWDEELAHQFAIIVDGARYISECPGCNSPQWKVCPKHEEKKK